MEKGAMNYMHFILFKGGLKCKNLDKNNNNQLTCHDISKSLYNMVSSPGLSDS